MAPNTSLHYCTSPLLSLYKEIQHNFFNRDGGVSLAPFNTLNLGTNVGDLPANILENQSRIKKYCKTPLFISMEQVHGDVVHYIPQTPQHDLQIPLCDALITNLANVLLVVKHADCQPLLFYDPVQKAIGCAHSGWKGSVLNLAGKTIQAMQSTFKSNPQDIIVSIGPSLGPDHAQFTNYKKEFPDTLWHYRQDNDLFNFWKITEDQLLSSGVQKKHIDTIGICTFCDTRFFSYRRKQLTGRNVSTIALRQ